ncbi:spindle assembly abnormal protein 6 homolog isoform X2 [Frankliniella occidentalis]|uniref:Spindle assembly abnormal protein 6 homolog isoform X2 n=1 Tax=Frankliniella occidentalis TaxID=133901 RepID=A0A6J1T8H1_FRAOC|nr:spindle assembly abnormal protein 6 homolog isoform X2 [Frankliniella occidentalis]
MVLDNEHCLYTNIQNVVMPNGKTKDLRVEVFGFGKQKVEVRITDDNDPALLYILHVSESDFKVIKSQQGLLVDFVNFPVHLVKLFEQCLNSVKGFLLILEENGIENYLKVVQPIDLKNLCYIALKITQGSDTEVMRHMQNQIGLLKKTLNSKEDEFRCLQSQNTQLHQELNFKEQQCAKNTKCWDEEKNKLQEQFSKEMDTLRDQLLQDRKRDLDSASYQRENLSAKLEDLNRECTRYKNKHMQICEKYEQAQQTVRELSMKLSSYEEMQKSMNRELTDLRRHKSELETECRKKDQDIDQTRSHADALDKEVARLRTRLTRQEGLLRQADSEHVKLKSALTQMQETIQSRSDLVLQLNGDLTKANLIIKENQKELDKLQHELQRMAAKKHEEESKLKRVELEMKLLRANAERDGARLKALEDTEKTLHEQLKAANEAILAKDEQHKKCGDLITYLNRSLNRQHLDPSPPSTAHGQPGHSALYNSAPSAPILYTLGSSLGRAGAGAGLHISGPPMTNQGTTATRGVLPFSSTPLVASTAAGGPGVQTRRSFPGAMIQPSSHVHRVMSSETPAARPIVDRVTLSQLQSQDESRSKKQSSSRSNPSSAPENQKVVSKVKSSSSSGTNPNIRNFKDKKIE